MKLLEAEPALAPAPVAETPPAPAAAVPEPGAAARACASCGAAMDAGQDWCLTCGSAAPGRLGGRPGWRPAFTIAALTLLVLAGAVVAAYAAMSGDAAREGSGPVAQSGAPVVPPAPVTPAVEQPPVPASKLPKVSAGGSKSTATSPVTPVDTTPSPTTTATPSGDTTPADTKPETTKDQPAAPPAPTQIDLASDAGAVYDPLEQAVGPGDVRRAIDGNPATSWAVGSRNLAVPGIGYVIDVGKERGIRVLEMTTGTPGFKVEVYATDEATTPPQITDTRWAHIRDKSKVRRTQRIVLGAGSSEYRRVLLWFTEPPAGGTRIRLAELRLLG
jgi:hypothetical protein